MARGACKGLPPSYLIIKKVVDKSKTVRLLLLQGASLDIVLLNCFDLTTNGNYDAFFIRFTVLLTVIR